VSPLNSPHKHHSHEGLIVTAHLMCDTDLSRLESFEKVG
jgi:hypothetical protein